jgi:lipopolysaccharide/colanic/teichoic acid biosynthesis glycosyltransferase
MRDSIDQTGKRVLDLVLATTGLVIAGPVLAVIAVAIRLDSAGPIMFVQERVGWNARPFRMYKFRTLYHGSGGALVTASGDRRVTRVGAILRRTKLDELAQLWNVVRGDMSLVGPRPEVPTYAALWPSDLREVILSVRPGITDPVSLAFRNEADELGRVADPEQHYRTVLLPHKAQLYAEYVQNRSLLGDVVILAQTVATLARPRADFHPNERIHPPRMRA